MNNMHGILFAYSASPRLQQLVEHRTTASLPYGGRYRLIDFMLSNMVNAGVTDIGVIMHENYQSLLDHLGSGKDWDLSRKHGGLKLLPPFAYTQKRPQGEFRGKLEALAGVYNYLERIRQDHVVLARGDMAINLSMEELLEHHLRSGADITAVCSPRRLGSRPDATYLLAGPDGSVKDVSCGRDIPGGLESLEIYVLSRELLLRLVDSCAGHNYFSFAREVLQRLCPSLNIRAFVWEGYAAGFRCVGDYYTHSMDLLRPEVRRGLFLPERPIRTKDRSDNSTYYGPDSLSRNSLVADGCRIEGMVENSVLFRGVRVEKEARISNCILMQGTVIGKNAVLKHVIADKNVTVNEGRMLMGHDTYPLAIAKGSVV